MFDPTSIEVCDETTVHMKDAKGAKLYEGGDPKNPEPVTITLYGPGSPQFTAASDARLARGVARRKTAGDIPMTGAELREENITFLTDVTARCSANLSADQGNRAFFESIYRNPKIGFWFEQLNDELKSWGNFSQSSPAS